jgi:hypothetical protein
MNMRRVRHILWLLFTLLMCSCPHNGTRPNGVRSSNDLDGLWQSDPYVSQLGVTTDTLCFSKGFLEMVSSTQGARLVNHGRYSANGAKLVITWESGSNDLPSEQLANVSLTDRLLQISWNTSPPETLRYRRVAPDCPLSFR